jgi:phosphoenolpyruvate carboxykinase (ATP)
MSLTATRALVNLALSGKLDSAPMEQDPIFGFLVPSAAEGVDPTILRPRDTWADKSAYDAQAHRLVAMFSENFQKFLPHVDPDVRLAAPVLRAAE